MSLSYFFLGLLLLLLVPFSLSIYSLLHAGNSGKLPNKEKVLQELKESLELLGCFLTSVIIAFMLLFGAMFIIIISPLLIIFIVLSEVFR